MFAKIRVIQDMLHKTLTGFFRNGVLKKTLPVKDADLQKALEDYMCSVNRYNNVDLSNPQVENFYFMERQIAFIFLRLAIARARIRDGFAFPIECGKFETMVEFVNRNRG